MKKFTLLSTVEINVITVEELMLMKFTKNKNSSITKTILGDIEFRIDNNQIDGRNGLLKIKAINTYQEVYNNIEKFIKNNNFWGLARNGLVDNKVKEIQEILKYEDENISIKYDDSLSEIVFIQSREFYEANKQLIDSFGNKRMMVKDIKHPKFEFLTYDYTHITSDIKEEIKEELRVNLEPKLNKIYELLGQIDEVATGIIEMGIDAPDERLINEAGAWDIKSLKNGYSWTAFEKANQYLKSVGKREITKMK